MTATAPNQASTSDERATLFAAAVRERLSDLPPEELDELLDGLQADLADRLADGEELGDPEAYAEELRQAAGLPEREPDAEPRKITLAERLDRIEARLGSWAEHTPIRRGIRDFVLSLRPLWWVLRGVAIAAVIGSFAGVSRVYQVATSFPFLLLVLVCIVVSVQWGRGAWAPKRWLVWVRRGVSALAILALLPVTGAVWNDLASASSYEVDSMTAPYQPGLTLDGTEIGNIFAYDCNGKPIDGVQLFTRDGKPLTTLQDGNPPYFYDEAAGQDYRYAQNPFATLPNGWSGWNVFPLQQVTYQGNDETDANGNPIGEATPAPLPFAQVPAVSDACPAAAGGSTGDASGDAAKDQNAKDPAAKDPASAQDPAATKDQP